MAENGGTDTVAGDVQDQEATRVVDQSGAAAVPDLSGYAFDAWS